MKKPTTDIDYHTAKSIKSAIASELARRVEITDELVEAHRAMREAQSKYRDEVRKAIDDAPRY